MNVLQGALFHDGLKRVGSIGHGGQRAGQRSLPLLKRLSKETHLRGNGVFFFHIGGRARLVFSVPVASC